MDADSAVRALSWLGDPDIISVAMLLVVLLEGQEVWISEAFFDMESDGQRVERIVADGFVVVLHVDEEGLLVAQVIVVLDLVRQLDWIGLEDLRLRSILLSLLLFIFFFVRWR